MTTVFAWICVGFSVLGVIGSAYFFDKAASEETAKASEGAALANERAGQANERAAALEREAAQLRYQLDAEIQKRAPRRLTDEQITAMKEELKGRVRDVTIATQADWEARRFGLDISIIFQEAGAVVHPFDLPPGDIFTAPAGLVMYSPKGQGEGELKDDPVYKALKRANLFGGTTAKPFATLTLRPNTPELLVPPDGYVIYIGQKLP
jgi:hypothetical protein